MIKKLLYLFLILLSFQNSKSQAQCQPGFSNIVVTIIPDTYPAETAWSLLDVNGVTLISGGSNSDSICIPTGSCTRFRITDTYGDGICCTYGIGEYTVSVDGVPVVAGGQFFFEETRYINCPPGSNCDNSFIGEVDSLYTINNSSTWYSFVPDSSGMYSINTCFPTNTCNTQIWVYDRCAALTWNNAQAGTLYYNDSACGNQAFVSAPLQVGVTYWIRIGGDISCTSVPTNWMITYNGPVVGCTDPAACNYNPIASVSNGTCIYPGDPNCASGPDLVMDQAILENSLSIGTVNGNDPCLIGEGCLSGYGLRDVINFSTRISNIGDADYFIGPPQTGNNQFVFDQCHGHWHYAGYAQYELYDSNNQPLQVGFKNGFCVLDLMCFTGTAKYGCGNMGISSGCADEYGAGLACQWLDITDVPAGQYTMVVRVNWDQSPDLLGRVEQRFDNNVAYVCINITRNSSNVPSFTILPNCSPIVDCLGNTFGLALPDCDGVCNGTRLSGDLDVDADRDYNDIDSYLTQIVSSAPSASCNDLNGDGALTVTDAARLNACIRYTDGSHTHPGGTQTTHRHCQFPFNIVNTTDTVNLSIGSINTISKYVNVQIKNSDNKVLGLQFSLSGLIIDSVVSVVPGFNPIIRFNATDGTIAIIDTSEVCLDKKLVFADLFRVYYSTLTSNTVCLSFTASVNGDDEETLKSTVNGCVTISGISYQYQSELLTVYPNPSTGQFVISSKQLNGASSTIQVIDALGKQVLLSSEVLNDQEGVVIDLSSFNKGVYLLQVITDQITVTERLVILK